MSQEDSKIYFGHYYVKIGDKEILLISAFFCDFITNKEFIMNYLENINWSYIITTNKYDLNNIIIPHFLNYPLLTQKYSDFILFSKVIKII